VILRGIGLGGWMLQEPYMLRLSGVAANQTQIRARIEDLVGPQRTETFYAAWRRHHTSKADVDSLASWGFNAIRVPLHYNLFTLPCAQEPVPGRNTWLETGWTLVDSLLSWCRADHIYLILDLHAAPGGQGNDIPIADRDKNAPSLWQSADNQQKMVALWRRLAERYSSDPWIGGYDLLNETNWGFTDSSDEHGCKENDNSALRRLLVRVTDTVRSVDSRHLIFIEGNCWANNFHSLLPVWDSNMAVSFHKYWNYNDQGSIQGMVDLRTQYQVPLWLGESGENSNTWTTDAIALMERNHISWTWWPLKKAGLNNPLEFHFPDGWNGLMAYWEGKGPKPAADEAYRILMALTSDVSASNNTYHRDVIDAMFRQVRSAETLPFATVELQKGTCIYAANYDLGRNGFAYYDLDTANYRVSTGHNGAGNLGGFYRNDGVDISRCADSLTLGFAVSHIETGEWMQYTVHVPQSGYYKVSYRVAAAPEDLPQPTTVSVAYTPRVGIASWQLLDYSAAAGPKLLDSCTLPVSGRSWVNAGQGKIYLSAGEHRLRFMASSPGFRLNYIRFE
jgi:hypothetical protein